MFRLSLVLIGLALVVFFKTRTARRPSVFVVASVLGGLAGMQLALLYATWQGAHLSDGGAFISARGVTLVPLVAVFLAAWAFFGALAGVLGVLVYRGASSTWGSRKRDTTHPLSS
jgi:hypothetical protein